jgi:tetratricopeptide (TPR) repeat protein
VKRSAAAVAILVFAVAAHAEGQQAVPVTTFLLEHEGLDEQALVPVVRALNDGLKRNARLDFKDLDTRLADFAQEVPQDQIEQGRQLLADGQKALQGLELGTAVRKLEQAIEILSKVLPYIKKAELADAMMALGAAHFENGDKREARTTFLRLLTWRSDYRVDVNRYPPALLVAVEDARKEVEKMRRGSLEIRSEPAGAQAYVDGRFIGVTPTFAEGLTIGEHWVTLKREGYKKAVMPATVSAKVQQLVSFVLERSSKYLLVEQALKSVEKSLGAQQLDNSVDNLREVLFVDHGVFLRVAAAAPGFMKLDAFLYDLRTRQLLGRVTRDVKQGEGEKTLQPLASQLYANVSYEAELQAPKDAPPPKVVERRKFYKTWWFWTACGVAVTGIVLGATLAPKPKDCGNNFCFVVTF